MVSRILFSLKTAFAALAAHTMRYIEITDGVSIKKSEVEAVEKLENGGSNITLKSGKQIETSFFYLTLLEMLEADTPEHESLSPEIMNKLDAFLSHAGHLVS